jgi:hypothetical protein
MQVGKTLIWRKGRKITCLLVGPLGCPFVSGGRQKPLMKAKYYFHPQYLSHFPSRPMGIWTARTVPAYLHRRHINPVDMLT